MKITGGQLLRLVVASVVAVAIGGAVAGIAVAVFEIPTQITQVADPEIDSQFNEATPTQVAWNVVGLAMMSGVLGLMAGGPVFVALGWPLHAMLIKLRRTGLISYALMGAIISGVVVSLTQAGVSGLTRIFNPASWAETFGWAPWFALAGGITTTIFWLIRRPDRIAPMDTERADAHDQRT